MSSGKDVVIIGAGAIGCSIAYHLARQGVPSIIIERESIAARASGKAAGEFSYPPHLMVRDNVEMAALFSKVPGDLEHWIDLFWIGYHRLPDLALELKEKGWVDIDYGEVPIIFLAFKDSGEKTLREHIAAIRRMGYYEGTWLEADDIKGLFPEINPQVRGGALIPYQKVQPYKYTLGLAQTAEKMGATIKQGEVIGFRHRGSRVISVVLATGTEIETDVVVLAMGPWSGQGASWLGHDLPISIIHEECLRVEVPRRLPPYALFSSRGYIWPHVDGTVDFMGFNYENHWRERPDFDDSLSEEAKTSSIESAVSILPSMENAKVIEHRGDLEGWGPDHTPALGLLPEWDNAYIAARFGTCGIKLSPGVGEVMANFIIARGHPPQRFKAMMEFLSPSVINRKAD